MEQVALLKRYYLLMRSDSTSVPLSSLIITEATSLIIHAHFSKHLRLFLNGVL